MRVHGNPRNFPTGTVSALLVKTRRIMETQAVQWIDGPGKTGGYGADRSDRDMKSAAGGPIIERGSPRLSDEEPG